MVTHRVEQLKRKVSFGIYQIALVLTLIFFILGIFIGNYLAYQKADNLEISQKAISAILGVYETKQKSLANMSLCSLGWDDLWKEKVEIGSILSNLENRLGKKDSRVLEQKRIYNLVQFRSLVLVDEVNKECGYSWDIILFFYTNDAKKGNAKLSEAQGYMLNTVYNIDKENIKIFSFDINALDESTEDLMNNYSITSFPSLVINEKVYEGFRSTYEIIQILEE